MRGLGWPIFGIFHCSMRTLSCSTWDLVPWPESNPGLLHWEHREHWTTRSPSKIALISRSITLCQTLRCTYTQTCICVWERGCICLYAYAYKWEYIYIPCTFNATFTCKSYLLFSVKEEIQKWPPGSPLARKWSSHVTILTWYPIFSKEPHYKNILVFINR